MSDDAIGGASASPTSPQPLSPALSPEYRGEGGRHSPLGTTWLQLAQLPIVAFALGLVTTMVVGQTAGASLGLFFGGVGFATLIVPPLCAAADDLAPGLFVAVAATLGVAAGWVPGVGEAASAGQWLACTVALLGYTIALCGVVSLLLAVLFNRFVAAALVTVVGLLWLTWPVWLSHALVGPRGDVLVGWLVPAHPLFAMNGVLDRFDAWDRHPLAYRELTTLNQDVFYQQPQSVLWATLVHAILGIGAAGLGGVIERSRRHRLSRIRTTVRDARV